ncbi:hypothetical protein K0M31_004764 [Melipona bicolor]|uniref:Uncharacterized protein n=1 Tax=Melipona bicolor TaxID=60889 RepID=A0AA40FVG6_9HYME|nr:hypothetical protein K0M31_004764 [Melipona bicolor]
MLCTMQAASLAAGALTYLSFSNLPDDTSSGRARSIRGSSTASPLAKGSREAYVGRNGARTAAAEEKAKEEGRRRKPRERNSCCSQNGWPCLKQNRRLTWAMPGESFDFACVTVFNVRCLDDDSADGGR